MRFFNNLLHQIFAKFRNVCFFQVFTGLEFATKSLLQKFKVFTMKYLAANKFVWTILPKIANENSNENSRFV